jgi:hypothetical protein
VFQTFAFFIQAYRAFLFVSINFDHIGFLSSHHIIIEKAASVFIHISLSFIQKSNVTRSQSLKINDFLGNQCTTTSFILIHIFAGKL